MNTDRVRTHPVNVSYLVVGLVFWGVAASWALRQAGVVDVAEIRWLFPLTLVVAGAVGLVAATVKGLSGPGRTEDTYGYPAYDDLPAPSRENEGEVR